jgi:hypothetical protein
VLKFPFAKYLEHHSRFLYSARLTGWKLLFSQNAYCMIILERHSANGNYKNGMVEVRSLPLPSRLFINFQVRPAR